MSTETISNCTYRSKYGDKINACYKKHADEARQKAEDKTAQQIQILRKEEVIKGQEQKPLMYVNKAEHEEILEDAVLMKRWASGEPEQKQVRFENPANHSDVADTPTASTMVRRRPTYTRTVAVRKKKGSSKKSDIRKKSPILELGDRAEQYDFLNSVASAPTGIMFGQIANGDIESVRKQLLSIVSKRRSQQYIWQVSRRKMCCLQISTNSCS